MYSYQHRYHAGSFADFHKHLILTALLDSMHKKETPFGVLDLFAGEGLYDLACPEAQKNKEHEQGIMQWINTPSPTLLLQKWQNVVQSYNVDQKVQFYPGSPGFIKYFLRRQDHAHLVEGHPQAFAHLQKNFYKKRGVHLHQRDAYEALPALLPQIGKRGIIFIDPSYEVKSEYAKCAEAVLNAYKRYSHGIFAIWYPLLENSVHQVLVDKIQSAKLSKVWINEWKRPAVTGLQGSGMLVINLPWGVDVSVPLP